MTTMSLSANERAALAVLAATATPSTGIYLCRMLINIHRIDTSPAGAHRTAASLVRKGLAARGTSPRGQVWYDITNAGRVAARELRGAAR